MQNENGTLSFLSLAFFSIQQPFVFCCKLLQIKNRVSDPSRCHSQRSLGETHICQIHCITFGYSTIYSKKNKVTAKYH